MLASGSSARGVNAPMPRAAASEFVSGNPAQATCDMRTCTSLVTSGMKSGTIGSDGQMQPVIVTGKSLAFSKRTNGQALVKESSNSVRDTITGGVEVIAPFASVERRPMAAL